MQEVGDEAALRSIRGSLPPWGKKFAVVLVEPKYEGNVGSVARLARNFGAGELILVNPPPLGDQAIAYSMHGSQILKGARIVSSMEEACELVDLMVGTSGTASAEKNHGRRPLTAEELARWSRTVSGRIGIAFGREDFGLSYPELEMCDLLVTIPANPEYPILNISHAASIVLYELWKASMPDHRRSGRTIDRIEKKSLMEHYERLLKVSNIPPHKIPISMINFRRMIGKAAPNVREFYSLMGTFSRAMDYKRDRSPYSKKRSLTEE